MPPASEAPARFLLRLDIQASITECHRPDLGGILILPIRVVPMKMPRIQGGRQFARLCAASDVVPLDVLTS